MKRFALLTLGLLFAALSWAQVKVVYHLSEGVPQASRAIGNIRNHLNADPMPKLWWSRMVWALTFYWTVPPIKWTNPLPEALASWLDAALSSGFATTP